MSLEQGFDGRYPYNAVASTGLLKGVHARMSIASKLMVIAFVVFTVANVEFASGVFGRGQVVDHQHAQLVLHPDDQHLSAVQHLAGLQPLWPYQAGQGQRPAGVRQLFLVCHAVQRRHGQWCAVLEHRRADVPPARQPVHRDGRNRGEFSTGCQHCHADHCLSLGGAWLGGLCDRGFVAGLFRLPQGSCRFRCAQRCTR